MLFSTFEFWAFFAICFAAYMCLGHRAQNRLLLVASYVFYAVFSLELCCKLLRCFHGFNVDDCFTVQFSVEYSGGCLQLMVVALL